MSPTGRKPSLFRCKIDSNQQVAGLRRALQVRDFREPAGDGLSTKPAMEDDEIAVVASTALKTDLYHSIMVHIADANNVDPAMEMNKWSKYLQIPHTVYILKPHLVISFSSILPLCER